MPRSARFILLAALALGLGLPANGQQQAQKATRAEAAPAAPGSVPYGLEVARPPSATRAPSVPSLSGSTRRPPVRYYALDEKSRICADFCVSDCPQECGGYCLKDCRDRVGY